MRGELKLLGGDQDQRRGHPRLGLAHQPCQLPRALGQGGGRRLRDRHGRHPGERDRREGSRHGARPRVTRAPHSASRGQARPSWLTGPARPQGKMFCRLRQLELRAHRPTDVDGVTAFL